MRVRLSDESPGFASEVSIEGDAEEFRRAAIELERVASGEETFGRLAVGHPNARDEALEWVVTRGSDPVRIRRSPAPGDAGSILEFHGGWQLLYLSAWLVALADHPGREVRLSWHKGHVYLAESALPLRLASR